MASNPQASAKRPAHLTRMSVCGYKCIKEELSIEMRPLTLLAGANSSGKSSMMQPLLLLKQTLEAPYDPGALLLDGPNVRITSADQMCDEGFSVGLEQEPTPGLRLGFGRVQGKGVDIESATYNLPNGDLRLLATMSKQEMDKAVSQTEFKDTLASFLPLGVEFIVVRERCFLSLALQIKNAGILRSATDLLSPLERYVRGMIHVPGLRGNPARMYKTTAVAGAFPGTFENYVASVVYHWKRTRDRRLNLLGSALHELGLTWKVDARQVNDTQVELQVGRLPNSRRGGARDLVSIADVGFGVSQTLPVVVALLAAGPEQAVYIEQPELHLHPRAQLAMAKLLCDAAKGGTQVIVETHSDLLLLGIQTLVAEGHIAPNLVKLHWFTRDKDGSTQIASSDLDEAGAYGDWPEDFGDVSLRADSRYLNAAEARLSKSAHAK